MEDKVNSYFSKLQDLIFKHTLIFITAIIVFIVGWWLINRFIKLLLKWMEKRDIDISLRPFFKSISRFTLRVLLILTVAGMMGIQMTSFFAILGAAGLAVGMALQGSLSNFAGGVIILILKPYKVGDFIESNGMSGTVHEIQIFHTYLTTFNRQELIIPNGQLANSAITNYSRNKIRGMGMGFKIGYDNDIDKIRTVLNDILNQQNGLVKTPAHAIQITELGDKYMTINVQAWFESDKFWGIHDTFREQVKKRFDKEGIEIPFDTSIKVQMLSK